MTGIWPKQHVSSFRHEQSPIDTLYRQPLKWESKLDYVCSKAARNIRANGALKAWRATQGAPYKGELLSVLIDATSAKCALRKHGPSLPQLCFVSALTLQLASGCAAAVLCFVFLKPCPPKLETKLALSTRNWIECYFYPCVFFLFINSKFIHCTVYSVQCTWSCKSSWRHCLCLVLFTFVLTSWYRR